VAGDSAAQPDLGDPCAPLQNPDPNALQVPCTIGSPPTVDGVLTDWPAQAFGSTLDHGDAIDQGGFLLWTDDQVIDDADCSAQFGLRWDESYLYIAAHVRDDVRGSFGGALFYQHDALEVYLDGAHDRSDIYGADDHQLIAQADGKWQEFANGVSVMPPTMGIKFAAGSDDGVAADWSFEMAVPWSRLGGTPPAIGREIGFDLLADDNDDPKNPGTGHWLLWVNAGGNNCPPNLCGGAGQCYPSCSTQSFGTIQLAGR
jgi:hypothetical protein